ncbi:MULTISPECIES: hypothetical protein [Gordonia]|jgi:hypothetical protein|uniref:hypothetical protein n=1 Tax=Gordonia TaxID=2053 RepID=UPI001BCB260F|nr:MULTISPECIES: hypothetical protein [Gordonia]
MGLDGERPGSAGIDETFAGRWNVGLEELEERFGIESVTSPSGVIHVSSSRRRDRARGD